MRHQILCWVSNCSTYRTTQNITGTRIKKVIRLIVTVASLIILPSLADGDFFDERVAIDNFKLGGADYVISGKKAIFSGNIGTLSKVQALFNKNAGDMRLFSPECTLNQIEKVCSSDRQVHLRSKSFTIDGVGFDLLFEKQHLFIRNNVKMRIFKNNNNLLGQ